MVIWEKLRQIADYVSFFQFLSEIRNNHSLSDYMELTILRQTARRGRLNAFLHDNHAGNTATSQLASILEPDDTHSPVSTHIMSGLEIANAHATGTRLDQRHYGLLLEYLNSTGMEYHSAYENVPRVRGTLILPPVAHHPRQVSLDSRTYSIKESHVGNSHIQFYIPGAVKGAVDTGYIEAIRELPLEGARQTFLLVCRHQPLSPAQLRKTPYADQPGSNLQTKVVKVEDSNDIYIIEQRHIISHLTVYKNPPRTFGLTSETMTICWGLNRRRR